MSSALAILNGEIGHFRLYIDLVDKAETRQGIIREGKIYCTYVSSFMGLNGHFDHQCNQFSRSNIVTAIHLRYGLFTIMIVAFTELILILSLFIARSIVILHEYCIFIRT